MEALKRLTPLVEYCRENDWPRLSHWQHWISIKHQIALSCVKRIGGCYMIDVAALETYIQRATIDEE